MKLIISGLNPASISKILQEVLALDEVHPNDIKISNKNEKVEPEKDLLFNSFVNPSQFLQDMIKPKKQ